MTIKEWLQGLADSTDTSTEEDSQKMQVLLHKTGFPKARVVLGCVYLEGRGQPASVHQVARILVDNC